MFLKALSSPVLHAAMPDHLNLFAFENFIPNFDDLVASVLSEVERTTEHIAELSTQQPSTSTDPAFVDGG